MAIALILLFLLVVGPLALLLGADSRIDHGEWRRPWQ
jgi:hypothetical protein